MRDRMTGEAASIHEARDPANEESVAARPLRVAMFVNEFPALSETFVLNQITGLLDLGHEVTILATQPRVEKGIHADVMRYALGERLRYRNMPAPRTARLALLPSVFRRDDKRPISLRALNPLRYGREASSLSLLHWAESLSSCAPFDVIHCHFGIVGQTAAYLREIGALQGRLVTTFHGVDMSACLDRDPDIYRHLFTNGDLFLPVSDHWRDKLVAHGCDPARIEVHRMGIDPSRFPLTSRKGSGRDLKLLTIGRLVEKKGVEYALRAVANLINKGTALSYEIIGDGSLKPQLEALANDLGIAEHVRFRGSMVQKDVVRAMQSGDVLLAPSVTDTTGDQEGIPVTIMEAMATGMPVVSSWHSGIPELVDDKVSGLLVRERDVDGIAAAIGALAASADERTRMGIAARSKIIADYNIDKLNRELETRYRSVLPGIL
ncbi:MAG: glycosyltransferase [Parvibaculum sp.]|uniref:glycosyltransferase n=1 Tax=Parvibaculum sp. TaxID=2024848 RepID=UPI0025E87A79|nr:glycosyltransferase [Parvibaculum sp.]MCE9650961.1 glycosyltransferase [Parvibaculum sp.]